MESGQIGGKLNFDWFNRNLLMTEFSAGGTWAAIEYLEGVMKFITIALGLAAMIFYTVKMYYDMKQSINKNKK